jgi:hypothetical protein
VIRLLVRHGDALGGAAWPRVRVVAVSAREQGRHRGFPMDGIEWHADPVALGAV